MPVLLYELRKGNMYKGHPWEEEVYGPIEYEWFMYTNYIMNMEFELNVGPFIAFCKQQKHNSNDLLMKILSRLSEKYLAQYVVAKNRKLYPARYPAGYVRKIVPDRDMIEWVTIREKANGFSERVPRDRMNDFAFFMVAKFPRLSFWLARMFFAYRETKDRPALLVSRNVMRGLGRPIVFHGTGYPGQFLLIPFGTVVQAVLGAPHAYGNIDRYEPFLKDFIALIEQPETIPRELIEKPYARAPLKTPEEAERIRQARPWKVKKDRR
jgi:hypothetical protein